MIDDGIMKKDRALAAEISRSSPTTAAPWMRPKPIFWPARDAVEHDVMAGKMPADDRRAALGLPVSSNPKREFGKRKPSPQYIPPAAIIEESVVMALGAEKYGPYNWQEPGKAIDAGAYYDAAMRHLMAWFTGEDVDAESGASPLAHVRACCAILIDARRGGTLIDNRPRRAASAAGAIAAFTQEAA